MSDTTEIMKYKVIPRAFYAASKAPYFNIYLFSKKRTVIFYYSARFLLKTVLRAQLTFKAIVFFFFAEPVAHGQKSNAYKQEITFLTISTKFQWRTPA